MNINKEMKVECPTCGLEAFEIRIIPNSERTAEMMCLECGTLINVDIEEKELKAGQTGLGKYLAEVYFEEHPEDMAEVLAKIVTLRGVKLMVYIAGLINEYNTAMKRDEGEFGNDIYKKEAN